MKEKLHKLLHHAHNYGHLIYFGAVAIGGPYNYCAAGLLVVGVAMLVFGEEA